jgi:hypothetical protein
MTVICLHTNGVPIANPLDWFTTTLTLWQTLGIEPTGASIATKEDFQQPKNRSFTGDVESVLKKLKKLDASLVWSVILSAYAPFAPSEMQLVSKSTLMNPVNGLDGEIELIFESRTLPLSKDAFLKCLSLGINVSSLALGYGLTRNLSLPTEGYLFGLFTSLHTKQSQLHRCDSALGLLWQQAGFKKSRVNRLNRLRDVYPINLITSGHLDLLVADQSLGDWINEGSGARGALSTQESNLFVWEVDKTLLESVRCALTGTGILCVRP